MSVMTQTVVKKLGLFYKYFPVQFKLIESDTSKDIILTRFVEDEYILCKPLFS